MPFFYKKCSYIQVRSEPLRRRTVAKKLTVDDVRYISLWRNTPLLNLEVADSKYLSKRNSIIDTIDNVNNNTSITRKVSYSILYFILL